MLYCYTSSGVHTYACGRFLQAHLKSLELERNLELLFGDNLPDAFLGWSILVRVVWALQYQGILQT